MTPAIETGKTLADKAMLVSLSISKWTAKKTDKKASEEVQNFNLAEKGTGNYRKELINKQAESVKKINSISDMARTFHYTNTLPWNDDGKRILPSANYLHYSSNMRTFKNAYMDAVNEFIAVYPSLISGARQRLGGLFDDADYPEPDAIHKKYDIQVTVDPLPDVRDFRIAITQEDLSDALKRYEDAQTNAMKDLWTRVNDAITKVHEKLADPEAIFRDSLIGNVAELTEMLPRMNITDDPALNRITKLVNAKIATLDPQLLRDSPDCRKSAATVAKNLLDTMAGYSF